MRTTACIFIDLGNIYTSELISYHDPVDPFVEEFGPFYRGLLKELGHVKAEAKKIEIFEKILHYLFSVRDKNEQEFRDEEIYRVEGLRGACMIRLDEMRREGQIVYA